MASLDADDQKFVRNIVHELSAFQKADKVDTVDENKDSEMEPNVEANGRPPETPEPNPDTPPEVPVRQSSRLIRLSRPVNPFGTSSTASSTAATASSSLSSVSSTSAALSSISTSKSNNLGSATTSSASGPVTTATPGSRLAALNRPGSPMHRILQRAQSPALAAAARISRQAAGETATTKTDTENATKKTESDTSNATQRGENEAVEKSNSSDQSNSEPAAGNSAATRLSRPARLTGSGITGSVLLRRPQSPLRHSQTFLSKHTSLDSAEVDKSETDKLDSPTSPSHIATSFDSSATHTDKVAIRNKLRANSFRLKDLLTKRPFVKPKDDAGNETKDDSSAVRKVSESDQDSVGRENTQEGGDATGSSVRDRTRWRVEGLSTASRPRSRLSERTATLISARSVRTRSRINGDSSGGSGNIEASDSSKHSDTNKTAEGVLNTNENLDGSAASNIDNQMPGSVLNRTSSTQEHSVTVGATLLRSPKTRNLPNVPSNDSLKIEPQDDVMSKSAPIATPERDMLNITDPKSKALSELEKESEPNLVFDSENIGQSDPNTPNKQRETAMTQSMHAQPLSKFQRTDSEKQKIVSEPCSPVTGSPTMRSSKSYDKTSEGDFGKSSPALKRSMVVTDLDKAMQDRDKEKLSSIFGHGKSSVGSTGSRPGSDSTSRPASESADDTGQVFHDNCNQETDLDARQTPAHHRVGTASPRVHQRFGRSLDEGNHSPPMSPPVRAVAPMMYKPSVNLEDAVKWPMDVPGKLDFRKMEVFEGQMLLNWLSTSIDKSHYLRLVMTKHDINVIACQICTCLIAAGVVKQLESKDTETIFKTDCMYYWTHAQTNTPSVVQDVNKLVPMWPPAQEDTEDTKPGLKYTEADHQTAMVALRHEYRDAMDSVQTDHQGVLDKARQEYETRLQQAVERIVLLQKEVEKYKCLAGIEKLTQNALSEADMARIEAGLAPESIQSNGFATPMSGTPFASEYHTPAVTPDCVQGNYPVNVMKSPADMFSDLTTPSELRADSHDTSSEEVGEGRGEDSGPPPAPPTPPPAPPVPGAPPPAPPPPGSEVNQAVPLKPAVKPMSPMKPLFWQRLQVRELKSRKNKIYADRRLFWEEIQEERVDFSEFDQLFSKINIEPSRRFLSNRPKNKAKQAAKVIAPKRSQTIGILLSSLRIEMSDIEHAILNFDTSQLSEEKLRQIYENRGDADELKKIREYIKKHPDTPLDKPDQFLYDLSLIPDYAERMFCFIFREAFQESVSVIETKMSYLKMTCQSLITSSNVKKILGLVLALGNYMNGGSKSRGQADGFGIDILPQLKDVKSKDNSTSLLYYTVQQYIKKFEGPNAGTERVSLPLPDPSDMNQGTHVNFDELEKELRRIKKDFEAAQERADKVIQSAKEHVYLQPFKDIMTEFFEKGSSVFTEQEENLAEGKRIFQEAVIFFCVKPKSEDKKGVTPEYFFSLWSVFCQDFKDTWKREQQRILKIKIKESAQKVKKMQENLAKKPVRTRSRKAGGLKDRLLRQGLLDS